MSSIKHLLESNKSWVSGMQQQQPDFFAQFTQGQNPQYLWIGCADSRVPPNQIVALPPGKIFVHRNIANMVIHSDLSCLSILQYAVDVLQVRHIIVSGHYNCGGIAAALAAEECGEEHGLLDHWLRHICDVYRLHHRELQGIADHEQRCKKLCELNVREQVTNVKNSPVLQQARNRSQALEVHGWIYNPSDGLLSDLDIL